MLFAIRHPNHNKIMNYVAGRELLNQPSTAFHNDEILQKLITDSIDFFHVSTFFETGTFRGDSLRFMINTFGNRLNYYSCEISKNVYEFAKEKIASDPAAQKVSAKIHVFNQSSPECVRIALESGLLTEPVLYWLDAHWYSYWPLLDELQEILKYSGQTIIVIDDFKIPFHSKFEGGFDKCGDVDNDLGFINSRLKINESPNRYDIIFPNYSSKLAGANARPRGYAAIYLNFKNEFQRFQNSSLLENFRTLDDTLISPKPIQNR